MSDLLLLTRIGGRAAAFRAQDIRSIIELGAITPVPRAPHHVAGLAALRSRVLTVIDCSASIELGRSCVQGVREAIVVEADGHPYALLVDTVEDVMEYSGEVQPVRTSLAAGWRRVARGMVEAGDDLLLLVDTQALLAGPTAQAA